MLRHAGQERTPPALPHVRLLRLSLAAAPGGGSGGGGGRRRRGVGQQAAASPRRSSATQVDLLQARSSVWCAVCQESCAPGTKEV